MNQGHQPINLNLNCNSDANSFNDDHADKSADFEALIQVISNPLYFGLLMAGSFVLGFIVATLICTRRFKKARKKKEQPNGGINLNLNCNSEANSLNDDHADKSADFQAFINIISNPTYFFLMMAGAFMIGSILTCTVCLCRSGRMRKGYKKEIKEIREENKEERKQQTNANNTYHPSPMIMPISPPPAYHQQLPQFQTSTPMIVGHAASPRFDRSFTEPDPFRMSIGKVSRISYIEELPPTPTRPRRTRNASGRRTRPSNLRANIFADEKAERASQYSKNEFE
ncbi:Oidioi.mRNA.OKI2018_I69.chr1.g3034.t1.cds [Oikopleura dioica]|uniref:Oidioi.mRNA.OKI2018_I69.chr1.g3034.t1.cds n=1 Tax=Oikopleura dioica TaxID=34765 RepID=A0ABN7SX53_OIKDI|nr:Oidioi.mRNA.OKI2018_I69.chr1.g3034.t1.cds [Oikopleura dioica]